ncbi:hypothetical protein J4Q44_G00214770 [Coregonus suidteri]|uniref:Uncharacterized protein n=1 Tax=Coregonus suidteri TaxID=861788 RepID=A0AAN8LU10_9TELE
MMKLGILTLLLLSLWTCDCKSLQTDSDTLNELLELLQSVGYLVPGGEEGPMLETTREDAARPSAELEKRDLPRIGVSMYNRPYPAYVSSRKSDTKYLPAFPMERLNGVRG